MQYFHSNKSFNQYKPHQSFWQKMKAKRQKKVVAGDIHQSTLKNPFKKEMAPSHNKTKLVWIFLLALIIGWVVLILTLPYFKINKVVVVGNKITKTIDVENYVRSSIFSRNNYFLFPDKALAQKIKQIFLYENVQIKKVFPDTIQVVINEKPASVIYDDNTNYYLLDADGKTIKQLNEFINNPIVNTDVTTSSVTPPNAHLSTYQQIQTTYGNFPVIFNDKATIKNESNLLSSKVIKSAIEWNKFLKEQGVGEVRYFKIGETDFNLKLFTKQPWYILINIDSNSQVQLRNLKIILATNHPIEYIDLRFGERVYWK